MTDRQHAKPSDHLAGGREPGSGWWSRLRQSQTWSWLRESAGWRRFRAACDGLGWFLGSAIVLLVFALMAFLLTIQSRSDRLLWTGARVVGNETGGVVIYHYHGEREVMDAPGTGSDPHYVIFVDRSDPTVAIPNSTVDRVIDIVAVGAPVGAAGLLILVGVLRRRRAKTDDAGFGQGLDDEFVQRKLSEIRGSTPPSR